MGEQCSRYLTDRTNYHLMTLSLCKVYQPFNWATKILELLELVIFIEALLLQLVDKSFSLIAINCALQCGWHKGFFCPNKSGGRGEAKLTR